jgi:hypothetical protein
MDLLVLEDVMAYLVSYCNSQALCSAPGISFSSLRLFFEPLVPRLGLLALIQCPVDILA